MRRTGQSSPASIATTPGWSGEAVPGCRHHSENKKAAAADTIATAKYTVIADKVDSLILDYFDRLYLRHDSVLLVRNSFMPNP